MEELIDEAGSVLLSYLEASSVGTRSISVLERKRVTGAEAEVLHEFWLQGKTRGWLYPQNSVSSCTDQTLFVHSKEFFIPHDAAPTLSRKLAGMHTCHRDRAREVGMSIGDTEG